MLAAFLVVSDCLLAMDDKVALLLVCSLSFAALFDYINTFIYINKTMTDQAEVTIFDRIINKEIPATVIYEDDKCLAFRDINPVAPVHFLLIPKNRDGLTQLSKAEDRHAALLGHLMVTAAKVAAQEKLDQNGYRLVINDGKEGGQQVFHLHIHVIGGK